MVDQPAFMRLTIIGRLGQALSGFPPMRCRCRGGAAFLRRFLGSILKARFFAPTCASLTSMRANLYKVGCHPTLRHASPLPGHTAGGQMIPSNSFSEDRLCRASKLASSRSTADVAYRLPVSIRRWPCRKGSVILNPSVIRKCLRWGNFNRVDPLRPFRCFPPRHLIEVLLVDFVLRRRFILGLLVHCLHSHFGSGHHCPLSDERRLMPMVRQLL